MFEEDIEVTLGDTGLFLQVRLGALLDKAHLCRLDWLAANGFPKNVLVKLGVEARTLRDEVEYLSDVAVYEKLRLQLFLDGLSSDCSAFRICCNFVHGEGETIMRVTTAGIWASSADHLPRCPPTALAEVFAGLEKTPGFRTLASAIT